MKIYPGRLLTPISRSILIDVNQFSIITELLGTPPDDVIKTIGSENVRVSPVNYTRLWTGASN